MGAIVVDTSVVIGLLDPTDALHNRILTTLLKSTADSVEYSLPASVLAEVMAGVSRYSPEDAELRRVQLTKLFGPVRVVNEEVAVTAAKLRAEHRSLRLPDALVIATGVVDNADTILTGDKGWAEVDSRVEVLS